ncbi:zinc metallopeptidase [Salirhabdus salicampi]|uniref:zinc metallopeptidase n=1 Tax=Salirhabdus salicampi TaxID=476102 RepID=UPI0020C47281|nr:zinc metallopeptidase [Salirhabdus salicampi]MCP8616684.1 zinc metallopeptidase [Salirhabdus salicampi]
MLMTVGAYLLYFAVLLILPLMASMRVRSTYNKYSKIANSSQMTGAQVARKILDDNGLYNVTVEEVRGHLTDHYDPRTKTVRLSSDNYHRHSQAAAAIAAHEVGHAIQDAEEYAFLRFRHALVPVASFGSNLSYILIFAGLIMGATEMFLFGIIFMAAAVLFQVVTLPVEFNASTRAMDHLVSSGVIRNYEERETKKVLSAAALTYVAGAVVALLELLRFILMFLHMNND